MHLPTPPGPGAALGTLAEFVRARLTEVGHTLTPLLRARPAMEILPAGRRCAAADAAITGPVGSFASAVATAAGPFAPTSYARTRLIRQMHASGLLSDDETRRAVALLEAAQDDPGLVDPPAQAI